MMTEIGIAQQRLFDDEEAQYADHTRYPHAPADPIPIQEHIAPELPVTDGINSVGHGDVEASEQLPQYIPQPHMSNLPPTGQNPRSEATLIYAHEPTAQTNHQTSSNYTLSTNASYNIFESSLRPSDGSYPDNNNLTAQNELAYKSPLRHNSALVDPYSPHDTLPFSSARSPGLSRSKSDNSAQQSHRSVDELAVPATIELPVVVEKKQRGRKKKQSLPDNDEDDELAQSRNQPGMPDVTSNPQKPEKRKPGRPPKKPLNEEQQDDQHNLGAEQPNAAPTPLIDLENTSTDPITEAQPIPTDPSIPPSDPKTSKKSPNEPKKKKIKRGKTMSITQTKTKESDVEDDVIWIDERPIIPAAPDTHHPQDPSPPRIEPPERPNPDRVTILKIPAQAEIIPSAPDASAPAPPAPKKRGRKRKNPVEETPTEQPPPPSGGPSNPQSNKENTTLPALDPHPQPDSEPTPLDTETEQQEHDKQDHPDPDPNQQPPTTPMKPTKGPAKHSPISSTSKVPYRVGLSRRARIAPLLKIVKR
ncbi:hypothetical protein BO71DRAFT_374871 [Aspergillus ellipticus CBS 707.79]|uniref:Uncharacterized protein n=1 Tax=Aspergillus ellipticus CBS 707.79 TaxID=1448320 RepID=A0A319E793_9EURO|nr:hypothetical protein BO71DRAFT_374871 [Aspergillus ellipticus CBS 707.79]